MIYELRTYTVKPGTARRHGQGGEHACRATIRGDNFGKLEGYWFTEIGPLNQVMHMWSYNDLRRTRETARRARQEPALDRASTFR